MEGGEFGDGGGVDFGVLADVEGLEVETVGADFEQERIDKQLGKAVAVVGEQRVTQNGEIAEEVGGAGVGLERGGAGEWDGGLRCSAETHHDAGDEEAEAFLAEALGQRFDGAWLVGGAEFGEVAVEEGFELGRDGDLLGGAAELLEDVLQTTAVVG